MMQDIYSIIDFIVDIFGNIASLYTTVGILTAVIALWFTGRVVAFFKRIFP